MIYATIDSSLIFVSLLRYWKKLVLSHVSSCIILHYLCNTFQSAYRPGHSTEAALLKVVNDLLLSLGKDDMSVLVLFDFSAEFDTIYYFILVLHPRADF